MREPWEPDTEEVLCQMLGVLLFLLLLWACAFHSEMISHHKTYETKRAAEPKSRGGRKPWRSRL